MMPVLFQMQFQCRSTWQTQWKANAYKKLYFQHDVRVILHFLSQECLLQCSLATAYAGGVSETLARPAETQSQAFSKKRLAKLNDRVSLTRRQVRQDFWRTSISGPFRGSAFERTSFSPVLFLVRFLFFFALSLRHRDGCGSGALPLAVLMAGAPPARNSIWFRALQQAWTRNILF